MRNSIKRQALPAGRQVVSIKGKAGFTLIELLVVISILGLLAGLVISNVAGARERARDAERKSDLREIQKALQMYKSDEESYIISAGGNWTVLDTLVSTYIKKVPDDPLAPDSHYYYQSDGSDYTLRACLENASDPQGTTDAVNCTASKKKFQLEAP